jgi:hypothetical protein
MNRTAFSLVLALTPVALSAQTSASAQSHTKADAEVRTGSAQVSGFTSVDAEVGVARERGLPTQPIRRRAAEARAKGRTEAEAAMAAGRVRANLEAAHEAMVRAGRKQPRDEETERGAYALERGYTSAQVEAVARSAPSDRSLVVAFDVLSRLAARGVTSTNAVAQVQTRLESRVPDAQISALASSGANAGVGVGRGVEGGAAAAGNAAAGATAGTGAVSATGAVSGAVGTVIKKP